MTHLELVEARWEGLRERVDAKVAQFVDSDRSAEVRLLAQAAQAGNTTKRVHWLRKAADVATKPVMAVAACRKGCAHCCHITVAISRSEAQVIAKETGRKLNPRAGAINMGSLDQIQDPQQHLDSLAFGSPCPFLVDDQCSIYEVRPLACRLQVNLDEDDLLCQLVEDHKPMVPYLNLTHHHAAAAALLGEHQAYDDIRQWFASTAR
ncbi:YkgJ family cysteine cluster protein [Acidovorax sp.]|uniref:YkgJ family cysteine cluster protein n=1 Tax=Acidovorax sp. TaxID=1872122 RepID=UPI00391EE5B1